MSRFITVSLALSTHTLCGYDLSVAAVIVHLQPVFVSTKMGRRSTRMRLQLLRPSLDPEHNLEQSLSHCLALRQRPVFCFDFFNNEMRHQIPVPCLERPGSTLAPQVSRPGLWRRLPFFPLHPFAGFSQAAQCVYVGEQQVAPPTVRVTLSS